MTSKTDMNAPETPEGAETCPTVRDPMDLLTKVEQGQLNSELARMAAERRATPLPDLRLGGTGRLAEKGAPQ